MYQFYISNHFKTQLKPYLKKHKALKLEIIDFLKNFKKDPKLSLGAGTYKIRVSTSSLKKGKQKGFRVILLLVEVDNLIAPIFIYFKGDKETIKKQEIIKQAKIIINELENL